MSIFEFILVPEKMDQTFENYQVNHGTKIIYDAKVRKITCFEINGQVIDPMALYKVGIQTYHLNNLEQFWSIKTNDVIANFSPITLCTSLTNVIEEYLMTHTNLKSKLEGRIQRINII
jgi:hypothetical protein